jgi:predicted nucleic-acid-binding protein
MKHKSHNKNTPFWPLYKGLKDKMPYSGFNALKKAWIAYSISDKKNDLERKIYYASVIQKLEQELGKTVTPFRELKICALKYYSNNIDLFSDDVTGDEVLKTMMENGYTFGKRYQKEEGKERKEK